LMLALWGSDAKGRVTGGAEPVGIGAMVVEVVVVVGAVVVLATIRGRVPGTTNRVVGDTDAEEKGGGTVTKVGAVVTGSVTWVMVVKGSVVRVTPGTRGWALALRIEEANDSPRARNRDSPTRSRTPSRAIAGQSVMHGPRVG